MDNFFSNRAKSGLGFSRLLLFGAALGSALSWFGVLADTSSLTGNSNAVGANRQWVVMEAEFFLDGLNRDCCSSPLLELENEMTRTKTGLMSAPLNSKYGTIQPTILVHSQNRMQILKRTNGRSQDAKLAQRLN